ncbi:MAG: M50 family metallopeptidase [Phycisphaerae bacterium]
MTNEPQPAAARGRRMAVAAHEAAHGLAAAAMGGRCDGLLVNESGTAGLAMTAEPDDFARAVVLAAGPAADWLLGYRYPQPTTPAAGLAVDWVADRIAGAEPDDVQRAALPQLPNANPELVAHRLVAANRGAIRTLARVLAARRTLDAVDVSLVVPTLPLLDAAGAAAWARELADCWLLLGPALADEGVRDPVRFLWRIADVRVRHLRTTGWGMPEST